MRPGHVRRDRAPVGLRRLHRERAAARDDIGGEGPHVVAAKLQQRAAMRADVVGEGTPVQRDRRAAGLTSAYPSAASPSTDRPRMSVKNAATSALSSLVAVMMPRWSSVIGMSSSPILLEC